MADDAANYEQNQMEAMEGPTHEDLYVEKAEREENRVYYTTNNTKGYIYDAITGLPHRWKVGSYDSLRLYSVIDATGVVDENGIKIPFNGMPNRSPNILYYESPEAYERHNPKQTLYNSDSNDTLKHRNDWYTLKARLFGSASSNQDEASHINMAEYTLWRDEKKNKYANELDKAQKKCVQEQNKILESKKLNEEKEKERIINFNYALAENKGRSRAEKRKVKAYLERVKKDNNVKMCKQGIIATKAKKEAEAEAVKIKQARRARNKAKYLKNVMSRKS